MASPPDTDADRVLAQQIPALEPRARALLRKLGAGHELDDLVQETMARAWRYRTTYDEALPLDRWLMKIAFRCFLDARNRTKQDPSLLGEAAAQIPGRHTATVEEQDELRHSLHRLTEVEQEILLRFHQQRESVQEISDALRMPEGTVKSHLHRARRRLAEVDRD